MSAAGLIRYDAARKALAEAVRFDDVKQIRDLAVAAQEYARQAKDRELIENATELRVRAEIRAGEILIEMRVRGERRTGGSENLRPGSRDATPGTGPTLKAIGITKTQSSRWQQRAAMPADQQEAHTAAAKKSAVASLDHATSQADKRQRRAAREQDLAEKTAAASKALGTKLYGVIYADPPWHFRPYSDITGMDRAADNHYPTMTLDDIKALPVPAAAAPDAVLFLWATVPMLPEALHVMAAWGFTYRSNFAWVKHRAGTGYWNRNRHELLLIGTRGDIPAPAPGEQYESVIEAHTNEHSVKPFAFTEIIQEMFPNLPRLEMFHRGETYVGWDYWGNE